MLKSGRGEFGQKVTQAAALEATSPPILTALHLFHQISSQRGETKGNQNKLNRKVQVDVIALLKALSQKTNQQQHCMISHCVSLVCIRICSMLISLFETPFAHFYFHPTPTQIMTLDKSA